MGLMQRRMFSMAALASLAGAHPAGAATPELRVLAHSSFNLPKALLHSGKFM